MHRRTVRIVKKQTKCIKVDKNEKLVYLVICLKREAEIGIIKLTYFQKGTKIKERMER